MDSVVKLQGVDSLDEFIAKNGRTSITMLIANRSKRDVIEACVWRCAELGHPEYIDDNTYVCDEIGSTAVTPLILASYYGDLDIVKILFDNGADVNKQNDNCMTALLWSTSISVSRFLLGRGSDPAARSIRGFNILFSAVENYAIDGNMANALELLAIGMDNLLDLDNKCFNNKQRSSERINVYEYMNELGVHDDFIKNQDFIELVMKYPRPVRCRIGDILTSYSTVDSKLAALWMMTANGDVNMTEFTDAVANITGKNL